MLEEPRRGGILITPGVNPELKRKRSQNPEGVKYLMSRIIAVEECDARNDD